MPIQEIAPSGDLILTLYPSTAPFAPWVELESVPVGKQEPFRARVSSAVLRLASPVLAARFDPSGPWGPRLKEEDGMLHGRVDGFDPVALTHVLNVIHYRGRLVPPVLPEEALAKVAVVVDAWQCRDAVTFAAQSWMQSYGEPADDGVPTNHGLLTIDKILSDTALPSAKGFTRSTVLWLFASVVFNDARVFRWTATVAVLHSKGPFNTLGLSFPAKIVGE